MMKNGATRATWRLIDANANRALEGLRVCEDIARFYLETPLASQHVRALRHGVGKTLEALPGQPLARLQARESRGDIGRRAPASRVRSIEQSLLINFQRAKEALRTLEEAARLVAPRSAKSFQGWRFRTYEIERELLLATVRHP